MAKTLPSISVTDEQYTRLARVIPGDTARGLVIDADLRDARDTASECRSGVFR